MTTFPASYNLSNFYILQLTVDELITKCFETDLTNSNAFDNMPKMLRSGKINYNIRNGFKFIHVFKILEIGDFKVAKLPQSEIKFPYVDYSKNVAIVKKKYVN